MSFTIPPGMTLFAEVPVGKRDVTITHYKTGEKRDLLVDVANASMYVLSLGGNACYGVVDFNHSYTFRQNRDVSTIEPVWKYDQFFAPENRVTGEFLPLMDPKTYAAARS